MPDREKIIKGLECLSQKQAPTANPCKDCGYINRPSFAICVKDIASDALELLKEQEAKNVTWLVGRAHCPSCGELFPKKQDKQYIRFCNYCGQAVRWGD